MVLKMGNPAEAGINPDRIKKIVEVTHSWVDKNLTPLVITKIARKGVAVFEDGYGKLTPEDSIGKLDMDTLYPLASISKVITTTIAMTLVEEGKLGLNRPVQEYIPEFTGEDKEFVAVYNLMTHSSGIKDDQLWEHAKAKEDGFVMPELDKTQNPHIYKKLVLGLDAPLWKMPGEEMSYCGYAFELLAEIIRRLTGKSLEQNARERIFDPLGMKSTFFEVPPEVWHRTAVFPEDAYCGGWFAKKEAFKTPSAAGGAYSTINDLLVFGQMFLNKGVFNGVRILSKATVEAMTRNQIPGVSSTWGKKIFKEAEWGLGWWVVKSKKDETGTLRSPLSFCHSGAGCSMLLVDPVNELVVANFTVSMVRLPNGQPLRRFDHIIDMAVASIEE